MSMSKVRKMNVLRTMVQENISHKKPYRSLVNELTHLKYIALCEPVSEELRTVGNKTTIDRLV